MARHKMTKGICNLCGTDTQLSFEHVPPKVAFNKNTKYVSIKFEDYIQSRNILKDIPKGKSKQGGIGYNSFCEKCNNFLGANYVNQYSKWVNVGMSLLSDSEFAVCSFEVYQLQPLAILKQIISMFLAINSNFILTEYPELSDFVLDKEKKDLPERYQIYTYLTRAERLRYFPYCTTSKIKEQNIIKCTEIAFPPFGFILTFDSKLNIDYLNNITNFKNYSYNQIDDFKMILTQLPTYTLYPLDYRSKDLLNTEIENNNLLMDILKKANN